jgi:hypothetical protein
MFQSSTLSNTGAASRDVRGFLAEFELVESGTVPLGSANVSNVLLDALVAMELFGIGRGWIVG